MGSLTLLRPLSYFFFFFTTGNWEGKLHVKIMQARDLEPKDRNGLSDPYCIAIVDSPYQKKQTKYVSNTLNPQWNYEATLLVMVGVVLQSAGLHTRRTHPASTPAT